MAAGVQVASGGGGEAGAFEARGDGYVEVYGGVSDLLLDLLGKFVSFNKVSQFHQLIKLRNYLVLHLWLQFFKFSVQFLEDTFPVTAR